MAFQNRHFHRAVVEAPHGEAGAQHSDAHVAGMDDEGPVPIPGYVEQRLPFHQIHLAKPFLETGFYAAVGVERDGRTFRQRDAARVPLCRHHCRTGGERSEPHCRSDRCCQSRAACEQEMPALQRRRRRRACFLEIVGRKAGPQRGGPVEMGVHRQRARIGAQPPGVGAEPLLERSLLIEGQITPIGLGRPGCRAALNFGGGFRTFLFWRVRLHMLLMPGLVNFRHR